MTTRTANVSFGKESKLQYADDPRNLFLSIAKYTVVNKFKTCKLSGAL